MSKFNQSGSYVCPVFATSGKCGEQDALEVMEQFKDFYETKLSEIDVQGGGDCLELKLKIQKRWIDDLTEQTQMMARIVKELEEEATSRVQMLEDKLRQTSKSAYEVMKRYQTYSVTHNLGEPFQKVFYLENDLKNLLEFIRRIRDDRKWNIDGLQFYDVTYSDLFGKEPTCDCDIPSKETNLIPIANGLNSMKKDTTPKTKQETFTPDQDDCNQSFEEMLKKKTEEFETLKQVCNM
jgi:exonuclease VII large subunit